MTNASKESFIHRARSWSGWLASAGPDLLIIASLVGLYLYANRFVDGLDTGGDAVSKWQFARQWSYDNQFRHGAWNHHMTRMGVNVVAWLGQKLCGPTFRTYYAVPMFMGVAQLPLVYALGRRVSGRLCGCLAALAIVYLPIVHTSVSQLLPDLFVGTYMILAAYLLARFTEASEARKLALLIGAALVAFVGYLAKETACFFYPGFGVAVWLLRRRVRDVAIFGGIQLLGLALETAAYRLLTDYSSRLAIARSVHFAGADSSEPAEVTFHGFFAIFKGLDSYWHDLLVAGALGAVGLVVLNRQARTTGRVVVALGLSHIALLGLSAQLWQNPLPRYMDPAIPFVAVAAAYLIATGALALLALPKRISSLPPAWSGFEASLSNPSVSAVLAIGLSAGLTWRAHQLQAAHPPFDGREQGEILSRIANQAYARNLPLAQRGRRQKTVVGFYNVYLEPARLARGGVLPNFDEVRLRYRDFTYLVKDRSVYDGRVFSELQKAGCVLELRNIKRLPRIHNCADATRHDELPASCDALLAELTRPPH